MEILHKEWLQVDEDGWLRYGFNQRWYESSFRQTRGCGPTVATMLFSYMVKKEKIVLHFKTDNVVGVQKVLEKVWKFVKPSYIGLFSVSGFCKGFNNLCKYYGLSWQCQKLKIGFMKSKRPSFIQVVDFIEKGLKADCPVGFVNLHKGEESNIFGWHWIAIVGLEYIKESDKYIATCYDGGYIVRFDVELWLKTSKLGGGFVYIAV